MGRWVNGCRWRFIRRGWCGGFLSPLAAKVGLQLAQALAEIGDANLRVVETQVEPADDENQSNEDEEEEFSHENGGAAGEG